MGGPGMERTLGINPIPGLDSVGGPGMERTLGINPIPGLGSVGGSGMDENPWGSIPVQAG